MNAAVAESGGRVGRARSDRANGRQRRCHGSRARTSPAATALHRVLCASSTSTKEQGMTAADKRKQSLYFPEDMLKEIGDEATRQDRSLSWVVQQAWRVARIEIKRIKSVNDTH